jgi:hypothetical protein
MEPPPEGTCSTHKVIRRLVTDTGRVVSAMPVMVRSSRPGRDKKMVCAKHHKHYSRFRPDVNISRLESVLEFGIGSRALAPEGSQVVAPSRDIMPDTKSRPRTVAKEPQRPIAMMGHLGDVGDVGQARDKLSEYQRLQAITTARPESVIGIAFLDGKTAARGLPMVSPRTSSLARFSSSTVRLCEHEPCKAVRRTVPKNVARISARPTRQCCSDIGFD